MSQKVFNIIIKMVKQGGADKETVRGLVDIKNAMTQGLAVAGAVTTAYYAIDKALNATVGRMVNYAGQIRQNSAALSLSSEETSRLTQVLDDFGIEIDSVQKALFSARKEGIDITVEGLANLADQYNALTDPQENALFLQEKFSKGGTVMAEVLVQGSAAILEHNESIQASLILDQKAVDMAFEYEQATDELKDSVEGLKVAIGSKSLPLVIDIITRLTTSIGNGAQLGPLFQALNEQAALGSKSFKEYQESMQGFYKSLSLGEMVTLEVAGAVKFLTEAEYENIRVLNEAESSYSGYSSEAAIAAAKTAIFTGLVEEGITAAKDYGDQLSGILSYAQDYDDYLDDIKVAEEELATLRDQGYSETGTKITGVKGKIADLKAAQQAQTDQWIFNCIQQSLAVDGIDSSDMEFLLAYQVRTGLMSEEAAKRGAVEWELMQEMAAAHAAIPDEEVTITTILRTISDASGATDAGHVTGHGRASGGPLPDIAIVGEKGWEAVVRTKNGQYMVIPHEASLWMQAAGLLSGAPGYASGMNPGGGGINPPSTGGINGPSIKPPSSGINSPIYYPPSGDPNSPGGGSNGTQEESPGGGQQSTESVEPITSVVADVVALFQASVEATAQETARQTRLQQEAARDQLATLKRIQNSLDSQAEVLAAEMQKRGK